MKPLVVVDTMPDFWEFWSKASELPEVARVDAFREIVIGRHPELYTRDVLVSGRPVDLRIDARVNALFSDGRERIDAMRKLSERVPDELREHAARFLETFPDFRYEGAIYLMVSLHAFQGAIRSVAGKDSLLFGIDEIARVDGPNADLTVLFDHELFHVFHATVFPDIQLEPRPFWRALWQEGLATLVTERLNPTVPVARILAPHDLAERARPILPRLARELVARLDSTDDQDYDDFFSGEIARTDIPPCSGYYVGLLVARSLCSVMSLDEVARWGGSSLRARIGARLTHLATTTPSDSPIASSA